MLNIRSILLALVCLTSIVSAGLTSAELNSLVHANGNKVLQLTDDIFEPLLQGRREHSIVVLLSSSSPQINCVLCREFEPEYHIVGNSWIKDHPDGFEDSDEEEKKQNIYFFHAELSNSKRFFSELQVSSIPKVLFFPPSDVNLPNAWKKELSEYQFYAGDHKRLLISWLQQATGHSFNIYIPVNYSKIAVNAVITFIGALIVKRFFTQVCTVLTSRLLWSGLSIVAVLLFTSGYMFNQIRGVPYVLEQENGNVQYFAPGQQNQFAVETQIISFIYGILSVLFIVLIKKVPEIKYSLVRLFTVVLTSTLIFIIFSILLIIFGGKGIGYPYRFLSS